ncbi:MAG: hypothetical protein M3Q49_19450 [Actinomycetota bacterium]|nr:hypothetical protein [Actinomycetota bacterium]
MAEYRSKLTRRGYETFEGGGRNDDLVYALALSCWAWSQTRQERRDDSRAAPPRSKQSTF